MAYVVIAYFRDRQSTELANAMVMAYIVVAYIGMACTDMADIVMADIVMAYFRDRQSTEVTQAPLSNEVAHRAPLCRECARRRHEGAVAVGELHLGLYGHNYTGHNYICHTS